ncbi:NicO-domain-containing protein [Phellopilus nigrolimitatus]|nr:NicO-domain-containing protein [Phellopilus nigrolimitatus]
MTKFLALRRWKLTLFGRSLLLITLELLANAACWIVAGLLFGRREETRGTLSLALLAWTFGLRHALDADHISAIDNATRGLISFGQLPVTCGLFFSLGHSTIVIAVNVAIAISTTVYDKIDGIGAVGGIVGAAVSGSFLFIIGLANSIILYKIICNRRRRQREISAAAAEGGQAADYEDDAKAEKSIMMRILGPVTTFVNKPWKMYPVGVLFGLGFDTASSIALLAVSALAKKDSEGKGIPQAQIVILPFLFTAGMTLVDSADSIVMLYSYAGFPERSRALFERCASSGASAKSSLAIARGRTPSIISAPPSIGSIEQAGVSEPLSKKPSYTSPEDSERAPSASESEEMRRSLLVKQNTMSGLSIMLTLVSILVAFQRVISLITIMGLIGDNCRACQRAAEDPTGGGLAGKLANDDSGFIGAAIVGGFVVIVAGWYGSRWAIRKTKVYTALSFLGDFLVDVRMRQRSNQNVTKIAFIERCK